MEKQAVTIGDIVDETLAGGPVTYATKYNVVWVDKKHHKGSIKKRDSKAKVESENAILLKKHRQQRMKQLHVEGFAWDNADTYL